MPRRIARPAITTSVRAGATALVALAALALVPSAQAFIYWGDYGNGRIGRAANDGSSIEPNFITGVGSPAGVAISATNIYWADYENDSIGRASIDGTAVDDEFISGVDTPRAVAVNGSSVFWPSFDLDAIGKADIDGTDVVPKLVSSIEAPCGIALDSGHIFWSDIEGNVGRSSLGGGSADPEFVVDPAGGSLCGVTVNTSSIYWVTTSAFIFNGTTIGRAKLSDGSEIDNSIIGDASGPCGITTFGSQLFWANAAINTIGRADIDGIGASGVNQSFIATGGTETCGVAVDSLAPPPPPAPAPPPPATDLVAPKAKIKKGPGKKLDQGIARFTFNSSEPGSTFQCKLDSRKPARCKSPKTYKGLKPGPHKFKLWATDLAGHRSKPAKRGFSIPE
jgi:hypothetical protein